MSSIPAEVRRAVDKAVWAEQALVKQSDRLQQAFKHSQAAGLPPIAIGRGQGALLSMLCQMQNAQSVLEIGTLGGCSTIWFANSVPGIKVTSIEFNPKHRDVALQNCEGLENVDIILGAALDVLPKLSKEGKIFDFVFIDAAWDEQEQYFDWAVKLSRKGSTIFVDNAVRQLTETEDEDEARALVQAVAQDARVDATVMPVLNIGKMTSKGDPELSELLDGFVMARVK